MSNFDRQQIERFAIQGMIAERDRLDAEIKERQAAMSGDYRQSTERLMSAILDTHESPRARNSRPTPKRTLSTEARKKMALAMKRRWKEAKARGGSLLTKAIETNPLRIMKKTALSGDWAAGKAAAKTSSKPAVKKIAAKASPKKAASKASKTASRKSETSA